jgi:hypothetical protein
MNRSLIILLIVCLILLAAIESFLFYHNKSYSKDEITRMFEPITSTYGIDIVYEIDETFLSSLVNPGLPAGPSRDSIVQPIRHRVLASYPRLLLDALKKYPVDVIKQHLNAIHFAKDINQHGLRYSGSVDPYRRIIYLVDDGWKDDRQAMKTFHHEFSSLLLYQNSLLLNPWLKQNPQNFEYLVKKVKSWDEINITGKGAQIVYEKGFVSDYGQVSFENDFNEYSAMIFTYPKKFKQIMEQYPRIRGKFLVWLEFYKSIDPIFTEEYLFSKSLNATK